MKYLLSLVLFYYCLSTYAQDFHELNFPDEEFCWQDYFFMDSLNVYKQDFIIAQKPAIVDDKYLLSVLNSDAIDKNGYLVNYKNLLTGETIWERVVYTEERYAKEFVNNFLIKDDVLELYLIEEGENIDNPFHDLWNYGHLALLRLDVHTGALIDEIRTDHYDPDNHVHVASAYTQRPYYNYTNGEFKRIDAGYGYSSYDENRTVGMNTSSTFSNEGHLVASDTTFFELPYCRRPFFKVYAWFDHNGNYSKIIGGQMRNDSIKGIVMVSNDYGPVEAIDISKALQANPEQHVLIASQQNKDKLTIYTETPYVDQNTDISGTYYILQRSGELIDSIGLTYKQVSEDGIRINNLLVDIEQDQFWIVSKFDVSNRARFQIYEQNDLGGMDTIFNLVIEDPDLFVFGINVFRLEDKRFSFNIRHRRPSIIPETPGATGPIFQYSSVIDLNKNSSSSQTQTTFKSKVFPNPATDYLSIVSEEEIESWRIFTTGGTLIRQGRLHFDKISIVDLDPGIFILQLLMNGRIETVRFIKV